MFGAGWLKNAVPKSEPAGTVGLLTRELPPTPGPHMLIAFSKEENATPSDWPQACPPPVWLKPCRLPSVGMTGTGNPLPILRIGAIDQPPASLPTRPR